jgi:hypothetical protein
LLISFSPQNLQFSPLLLLALYLQVRQELADVQAKRALVEAFMGDMKQVQELEGYPFFSQSCFYAALT